jgi:hypothetical protein
MFYCIADYGITVQKLTVRDNHPNTAPVIFSFSGLMHASAFYRHQGLHRPGKKYFYSPRKIATVKNHNLLQGCC